MDGSEIAALIFGIALILVTGAVVLLRPIAVQVAELLAARAQARREEWEA